MSAVPEQVAQFELQVRQLDPLMKTPGVLQDEQVEVEVTRYLPDGQLVQAVAEPEQDAQLASQARQLVPLTNTPGVLHCEHDPPTVR